MKVAIINFSGNVGKTTLARQLLAPRMKAPEFAVETINAGASDETDGDVGRLKGKEFGSLQEDLMQLDSAIVDIGASNVEEFVRLMGQFDGSHEEFDYYLVPVVSEKKQQADTVNTIQTLARLGVPAKKIRVVFNKVDTDDAGDLARLFEPVFGYHDAHKGFTLRPDAVLFSNEIFERLRPLKKTVSEVVADETDYRTMLREAKDEDTKAHAVSMISAQRLARSAHKNLDEVYRTVFR
ncbi:StbB family protein [Caballeronia humi]|uniref:CobQ/CobB/MinD/ParA nucleotide binding domain protein n=1 Tax=Caballeronia humi TaxID=326474 RepID=A0A158IVK7_9BURK|nr:StbB family protein [Caballeronia humi]SAL60199.1 CobQ/CobB/MinD/ParA nucleotide binding domain protein [Caballeronia humi]